MHHQETISNLEPDTEELASLESGALESGARGAKFRERRDVVSRTVMEEHELIRFVIGPDNAVVPDIAAKLPGRGIWVAANRESVIAAAKGGHFARSAKTKAIAATDLPDQTQRLLERSVLGLLGLAQRSGKLESGFDSVRGMIAVEPPALRIAASEAARDGRNKIRVSSKAAWNATPMLGCFTSAQLGQALGREDVTHAALREGKFAKTLLAEIGRLSGFCDIIPNTWETELEDAKLAADLLRKEDA